MSKLLTISIAAYDMERYITRTLDSLTDERIIRRLEIFVVDDGGTDGTLRIAETYAARYPESVFPVHKENGGYGTTVNYSVEHATGKYFKCLDGDDRFDREGLYRLVQALEDTDADVVVTPFCKETADGVLTPVTYSDPHGAVPFPVSQWQGERVFGMWALTFKTSVIRASRLTLPGGRLYTDQIYATIPFFSAGTMQVLDDAVYYYRVDRDGQSVSLQSRIRHSRDALANCEGLCRYFEENRSGCEAEGYLLRRIAVYHALAVRTLLLCPGGRDGARRVKAYDGRIRTISRDIYDQAGHMGKTGLMLRLLRGSGYMLYWPLKLLPAKWLNFK